MPSPPARSPVSTYAEAKAILHNFLLTLAAARQTQPENVRLASALGRILAQPIQADRDQPPFPRSTRDGFACRASEVNTGSPLTLAGQIRAGESPSAPLALGQACEIMTGAPVPSGADCVLMVEHAELSGNSDQTSSTVRILGNRQLAPGENIVLQGAEAHAGDTLLSSGIRIAPPQIALAAQCGLTELQVAPRPRVAILTTGDELVPVSAIPGPSQIRNSNAPMLAAMVASVGAEPVTLPTVPDRQPALDEALAAILNASPPDQSIDLLLISGGISAGKFDLVEDTLLRAGATILLRGAAIQPGKPLVFGHLPAPEDHDSAILPFFALPGNPISSAVTFQLFAAPVLAVLAGQLDATPRFASALFRGSWQGKPGLTRFLPAHCNFLEFQPEVRLIPWQGSGDLAAYARSNCLAVIPAEAGELKDGAAIQILLS